MKTNIRLLIVLLLIILKIKLVSQSYWGYGVTMYPCNTGGSPIKRSSFTIDNNGNKWIGFNSGNGSSMQLVRYNGTSWWKIPSIIIPNRKVNALTVDGLNNIWVGTDYGIYVFQDTNLVSQYSHSNSTLISDTIVSLAAGGGNIYVGTCKGLSIFNGTSFINYNHSINGLSHDTIYSIAYESTSSVWLGNKGGLEKFYGSGFTYFYNLGGLGSDSVLCIYIDSQNNKWLGTNHHGVIKYDNTNFFTMTQAYGTPTGVGWPVKTYSIGKGPNGGVFFSSHHSDLFGPFGSIQKGSLEVINNSVNIYGYVAGCSKSPTFNYNVFGYDPIINKVFYVDVSGLTAFLFSFDTSLPGVSTINQNNSDYLDINNVKALINSNDDLGWDLQGSKYFVPANSKSSPLKAASLWIGGYHNGALHMGAMTYRQNGIDFWPGPLDTIKDTIDVNTQNAFNRVWKINRFDIANFIYNWNAGNVQNGTFIPHPNILSWPAHGHGAYSRRLAPFVDVNGNGIYDPIHDGDYPLIKGDQMIWWIFNDNGAKHSETASYNMGIEVHARAYAYVCPNITDSNKVLNYTTFYNYKIINRSANKYDSCYISNWMDTDLGYYLDDYIGCDVMNNYGYTLNGDNYDEDANGMTGYHTNLPIFACNILNGPSANPSDGIDNNNNGVIDEANEKCLMHTFTYYTNTGDPQSGNPFTNSPQQYYNFMEGKWRDGTHLTYGGNGTNQTNPRCNHLFLGNSDPYGISMGGSIANPILPPGSFGTTGWTQQQAGVVKNDMRFLTGVGPFTMQPGGSYEFDCAFVFSQDSVNCDSNAVCVLTRAQQDNIRVKRWFDTQSFPSCLSLGGVGIQENANHQLPVKIYPNPASNYIFIELIEQKNNVSIEIFDMLGNLVKAGIFNNSQKYISIPIENLSKGLYSVRIKSENVLDVKKFIKD
ncbi:MAG TPA: T9SS type A sorting domain-containing protein [Bacteroidia bacterium]|jgi:hypothetical protein|nr:T9SS type A sorting domain-containing protein [Bacteroidia bacterium]